MESSEHVNKILNKPVCFKILKCCYLALLDILFFCKVCLSSIFFITDLLKVHCYLLHIRKLFITPEGFARNYVSVLG